MVKINFDRAFTKESNRSCSWLVIGDSLGKVLVARTILHQNVGSLFALEGIACYWALQTCRKGGWLEAIIEGDSLSIIRKCNTDKEDISKIDALIRNIKKILT